MSLHKVLRLVDVILRVPPLFIIDELFRTRLGLTQTDSNSTLEDIVDLDLINQDDFFRRKFLFADGDYQFDSNFYRIFFIKALKFIISFLGKLTDKNVQL